MTIPSLRCRMLCWLYEGILLFGVGFTVLLLLVVLGIMLQTLMNGTLLILVIFVVFGVYCAWFWAKGQTLAMKTWHIRVVDARGESITQTRALGRYCLSYLWFLPPLVLLSPFQLGIAAMLLGVAVWVVLWALLSLLHPQKQFWHDALAGTQLVLCDT
ncbi:MAG: hypothetical protein RIR79_414 [Pseudomonadota bacterium]